jgi:tripartite-type tricarboxylate transporter receptor subunit TctC
MEDVMRKAVLGGIRIALGLLLAFTGVQVGAETWPSRPIRMVIPFPPGGVSDVLGRFWAQKLSTALGQPVVVENKPGAGTTIASDYVAKSAPDGYTIYFTDVTSHAINATLYKKLPYDSLKDFTPIALVAASPLLFVVPKALPPNTVNEFIALAKQKPMNYASSGNGTILHLSGEMLKSMAGIDLLHVPYKGSAPAVMATLGGQTSATFSTMPAALPQVQAGKLKALGITSPNRNPAVPTVPTMNESLPGFQVMLYSGILGPAGMPEATVNRLNAVVAKELQADDTKQLYASMGAEPVSMSPADFERHLKSEIEKLGKLVRASGSTID